MKSILFVCLHNACRSRIAEAVARRAAPARWTVASAGTAPSQAIDPKADAVLRRHGLAIVPGPPKSLSELPSLTWDCAVGMGGGDIGGLLRFRTLAEWLVADPHDAPPEVYEALYRDICGRVLRLLGSLNSGIL